jgi:hypothetical protein
MFGGGFSFGQLPEQTQAQGGFSFSLTGATTVGAQGGSFAATGTNVHMQQPPVNNGFGAQLPTFQQQTGLFGATTPVIDSGFGGGFGGFGSGFGQQPQQPGFATTPVIDSGFGGGFGGFGSVQQPQQFGFAPLRPRPVMKKEALPKSNRKPINKPFRKVRRRAKRDNSKFNSYIFKVF